MSDHFGYLTAKEVDGHNQIAIVPCGGINSAFPIDWSTEELAPYINYMQAGQPMDRMFGGIIFKAVRAPDQSFYDPLYAGFGRPANRQAWAEWIEHLFAPAVNLQALASISFFHKPDIWIAPPYPIPTSYAFGELNGRTVDFNLAQDRIETLTWWIDLFLNEWSNHTNLSENLQLQGFVWPRAFISKQDQTEVCAFNHHIHIHQLKTMWLPSYGSPDVDQWRAMGFDAAAIHPNYTGNGYFTSSWIDNACNFAKVARTGIQLVGGKGRMYSSEHLLEYLNRGLMESQGYMENAFKVYTFPNQTLNQLIQNDVTHYEQLYSFLQQRYVKAAL